MNKKLFLTVILALIAAAALTGCQPKATTVAYPVLPDELKDCKFFYISNGERDMQVVRCPNSTVSTRERTGKTARSVVIIDGVTYEAKEK